MCGVRIQTQNRIVPKPSPVTGALVPELSTVPVPAGCIGLSTPRESSPEENHPPPKVTNLRSRREQAQGSFVSPRAALFPCRYQSGTASLASLRETQRGAGTSSSLRGWLPFPHHSMLCALSKLEFVPPSKDFGSSAPRSKRLSEHHHLSPLCPEAKPLPVEESRVLSLPGDNAVPASREAAGSG